VCSESANADGSWSFVRLSCAGVQRTGCLFGFGSAVERGREGEKDREREVSGESVADGDGLRVCERFREAERCFG
jgi:hypothetical protein